MARRNVVAPPNLVHGFGRRGPKPPEYTLWRNMLSRCTNAKRKDFHRYGGRGITVCERWLKFESFIADVGLRPFAGATLERIENDKGYSPDNCRWATYLEQAHNTGKRNSGLKSWDDAVNLAEARMAWLQARLDETVAVRNYFLKQRNDAAHYGSFTSVLPEVVKLAS